MMISVAEWLKNPEYDSGITLFCQLSQDDTKKFFASSKAWKLKRLVDEIKLLPEISVPVVKSEPKDKLPAHVQAIKNNADRAWKEARDLHSTILSVRSKNKRKMMAKRILELRVIAFDGWDNVKAYTTTGKLIVPEAAVEPVIIEKLSLIELINKVRNIPGYITKFKNQISTEKSSEKINYLTTMIAEKEAELAKVNARIAELDAKIKELCL